MARPLLVAFLAFGALALSGCGPTCSTACNRQSACAQKLGSSMNVQSCVDSCEQMSCGNKGGYVDCMSNLQCDNSLGYLGELVTCSSKC